MHMLQYSHNHHKEKKTIMTIERKIYKIKNMLKWLCLNKNQYDLTFKFKCV